ncbi:MAG: TetR/AcrR family transcriptional regulator [Pseudomonadota bacterium]
MARYGSEHKRQTRNRLVEAAARLFRRHGYDGVGIDQLCAGAGLTRGAFYAHFPSKAGLLAAVLDGAHDLLERLRTRPAETPQQLARGARQVVMDYLHGPNREAVLGGCSFAALAMDTVRGDEAAQAAYAAAVESVIAELGRGQAAPDRDAARAALALCVGGLLISGGCGGSAAGKSVARAARREASRLLQPS